MRADAIGLSELTDLATPYAIRALVTLGVVDAMAGGPAPVAVVAEHCGVDPGALDRVLALLATRGFVDVTPDGYALGAPAAVLVTPEGAATRGRLVASPLNDLKDAALARIADSVRTGEPVHGRGGFWSLLDGDPALAREFDAAMSSRAAATGAALATLPFWRSRRSVADLGGGDGTLLAEIAAVWPHLDCTVVERRPAATRRVRTVVADIFESVPVRADTLVLSSITGDHPDELVARLLAHCAAALPAGGVLVHVGRTLDTDDEFARSRTQDVYMLTLWGGRERTSAQVRDLLAGAGLAVREEHRVGSQYAIVAECAR